MIDIAEHFVAAQEKCQAPDLAFGVRIGDEMVASANEELLFRIASMSKSFTAAAILLLRDRGQLQLEQLVADIVPQLESLKAPVTIYHLLTMSSGLATDDPWGDRHLDADVDELNAMFEAGGYFALDVGTGFSYSNYGYTMLGRVIDNVSGMPFHEFVANEFLMPLEMTSTTYATPMSNFAEPHRVRDGQAIYDLEPQDGRGGFGAMAGVWSNVTDLMKWTRFLSKNAEMQLPRNFIGTVPQPSSYGYGLRIRQDADLGTLVEHSGGLPGYGSNMIWSNDRDITIVSMANVTYAPMVSTNIEALRLIAPALQRGPDEVMQPFVQQLLSLFNNWDDEEASQLFADNVVLDEPFDRRRAILPQETLTLDEVTASSRAQAKAKLNSGKYELSVSLTPTNPPKIQWYQLEAKAPE